MTYYPNVLVPRYAGIYLIRNIINGKLYVGQSVCLRERYLEHYSQFARKTHKNSKLRNAIRKYNVENFQFEILEKVDDIDKLTERENYYIEKYDCIRKGYNIKNSTDQPRWDIHMNASKEKNKNGLIGVHYHDRDKYYYSQIQYKRSVYNLGVYSSAIEAAKAYDSAVLYLYKNKAITNFEDSKEKPINLILRENYFSRYKEFKGVSRENKKNTYRVNYKRFQVGGIPEQEKHILAYVYDCLKRNYEDREFFFTNFEGTDKMDFEQAKSFIRNYRNNLKNSRLAA